MFFRSLLIPIALFQVLPSRGEDFSVDFADDGSIGFPFDDSYISFLDTVGSGMETCFEGVDLNELMVDPFAAVGDYCNPKDTTKFNNALNAFERCSHFDLKEVIETISSVFIGLALNCGSYLIDVINSSTNGDSMSEVYHNLPRVPDQCVDAYLGDNPFGNMMMVLNQLPKKELEQLPKKELECFADLADTLPDCTLKEWPIPIVGNWLKIESCMIANTEKMLEPVSTAIYTQQLEELAKCLPAEINEKNCQEVLNQCRDGDDTNVGMMSLPAPFTAQPMPATMKEIAKGVGHEDTSERYEQYRQSCVAAEDRAIMERVPGITSQFWGLKSPFQVKRGFSLPSFLSGAIGACVLFFAFSKINSRKWSKTHDIIELKDLELSTETRFEDRFEDRSNRVV